MSTWENCVEAQALRTKGWSISAIANHLGHDRKTIRAYLNGERRPGERKPARAEAMEDFLGYCRQRLADDPHLWSTTLFDEVVDLGFTGSYQAFTASVRRHELRPRCAACAAARSKDRSVIDHPPGEEVLCGMPHNTSYEEPGNMRCRPRRFAVCPVPAGSGADGELIEST